MIGNADEYNDKGFDGTPKHSKLPVNFEICAKKERSNKVRNQFESFISQTSQLTMGQKAQVDFNKDLSEAAQSIKDYEEVDSWKKKID